MASSKSIVVTAYSNQWPVVFRQLKEVYQKKLSGLVLAIEHVGSTSVPGLKAKPIIDIDIIVNDTDKLNATIMKLGELGYRHKGDLGIAGREAFECLSPQVPLDGTDRIWPDHHLYVCLQDSLSLMNHLKFRNYLRTYPGEAQAYALLKEKLAAQFATDIDRYVEGKTTFITDILHKLGFEQDSLAVIRTQNQAANSDAD
ncbi:GrpB family protein [Mucilaginibacter sp. Bleaf8]|uniref:GrpB family protein n=1 Tax=Mucilaginibacter sp. Bleaf8 TaxID=2834430 RepID=UPI001BD197BF|nr:GrpB family protein [Mucilaginibacter sp. Bleaf8]